MRSNKRYYNTIYTLDSNIRQGILEVEIIAQVQWKGVDFLPVQKEWTKDGTAFK